MSEKMEYPSFTAREVLLAQAAEIIKNYGASELRTEKLLKESKASFSSLYHHFHSREELIREATISLMTEAFSINTTQFAESASHIQNFEQFCHLIASTFNEVSVAQSNLDNRRLQTSLVGIAGEDKILNEVLVELLNFRVNSLSPSFQSLVDRGVISAEVNASEYAALLLSLISARTFIESDVKLAPILAEWNKYIVWGLNSLASPTRNLEWNSLWELRINNPLPAGEDRNKFAVSILEANENVANQPTPLSRRSKIIAQTLELMSAHSSDSLRVSEIARACGIATSGIYKYFPNKESLIKESLLEKLKISSLTSTNNFVSILKGVISKEHFRSTLNSHFSRMLEEPSDFHGRDLHWRIFGQSRTDEVLSKEFISIQDRCAREYFMELSRLQENEYISHDINPISLTYLIIGIERSLYQYRLMSKNTSWEPSAEIQWLRFLNFFIDTIY